MAMVLDAALSGATNFLMQLVKDELAMLINLPGDIKELEDTMDAVQRILADASRSRNGGAKVEAWLRDLTDFMYTADDILDACKAGLDERRHGVRRLVVVLFKPVAGHKIGQGIKKLTQKLDAIHKRWSRLNVIPVGQPMDAPSAHEKYHSESPLSIRAIGEKIKKDTEKLVQIRTATSDHQQNNRDPWTVIAIVGAVGIGKTALAKNVLNHPDVAEEFSEMNKNVAWVNLPRVRNEHTMGKVLHTAILHFGGRADYFGMDQSKAVLHPELRKAVAGKKILLVLDNMWTMDEWNDLLKEPLMSCAQGSWIIVTTRNMNVADKMKAAVTHHVTELNVQDGWALLKEQVSRFDLEEGIERLKEIGEEIVQKCQGLPLAICEVGQNLCINKRSRSQWRRVSKSISTWSRQELPENIKDRIYSSYEDLPSHLKQCFLYCSLIPKGRHINRGLMSEYWVAEGFIVPSENSEGLEMIGERYFRELVARNLLHPISSSSDESNCRMHDVIRCFAQYLIKEESICEELGPIGNKDLERVRRLILTADSRLGLLQKEIPVRTLFTYNCPQVELRNFTTFMLRLRIIELVNSALDTVPDSLYCLKHLRYLGLSETNIDTISSDIKNLRFLQYLHLENCQRLQHLPGTIVELVELRGLFLEGSNVKAIPTRLKNIPKLVKWTGFSL